MYIGFWTSKHFARSDLSLLNIQLVCPVVVLAAVRIKYFEIAAQPRTLTSELLSWKRRRQHRNGKIAGFGPKPTFYAQPCSHVANCEAANTEAAFSNLQILTREKLWKRKKLLR